MLDAARRTAAAERARRHRARLREGRVIVSICIEPERLVPMLLAGIYLQAETEARTQLAQAIERMLQDAIRGYEASLPA
jgi:hypothetical protein